MNVEHFPLICKHMKKHVLKNRASPEKFRPLPIGCLKFQSPS